MLFKAKPFLESANFKMYEVDVTHHKLAKECGSSHIILLFYSEYRNVGDEDSKL